MPRAEAVPDEPPDRLPPPDAGSARLDLQRRRSRSPRSARAASTGRGVDGATQTSLDYLPEHATDFVFASLAEQRGFVGAAFLLLLYLLVVWRGLKVVAVARDAFSAIVAGGIVFAFLFQIFVNVGMTIGIAPITGIPLPFVSVGGSSMIANLARDRRAAGDLRPRARTHAGRALVKPEADVRSARCSALLKGLRASAGSDRPLVVSGPRCARLALLRGELTRGGVAAAVREQGRWRARRPSSTCSPASSDHRRRARAARGVPGAGAGRRGRPGVDRRGRARPVRPRRERRPRPRGGAGFPVDEIAKRLARVARRGGDAARRAPAGAARRRSARS